MLHLVFRLSSVVVAWLALAFMAAADTVVTLGSVSQITGPQDLDLEGDIVYAINFSADDPVRTVHGVPFRPDRQSIPGVTLVGPRHMAPWETKPEFGSSADADALEEICADIRWAHSLLGQVLKATLAVTQGAEYKLQIVISENRDADRRWDIRVNGQNAVDEITSLGAAPGQSYSRNRATLYTCQFNATSANVVVEMGRLFGATEGLDQNPIWQALTLERVLTPPTPDEVVLDATQFFPRQSARVGTLGARDRKSNSVQHTFALVAGEGATDNAKFSIAGTELIPAPFDFSRQRPGTKFSIRVRATDAADPTRFLEKPFTLEIAAPHAPTAVALDASSISSAVQPGMVAGHLSATDQDAFDVHTFTLVAGAGATHNAMFTVAGRELRFAQTLPAGETQVQLRIRATDLAGLTVGQALTLPVVEPKLRINEFLAGNLTGLRDENLRPQDWIELYNEQAQTIDLTGWYLTDNRDNLTKWRFPTCTIGPNGYLIIFADGTATPPGPTGTLHANFSLDQGGEWLALTKPDGRTIASKFDPPEQLPDISYGFGPDGQQIGYLTTPTPAAVNAAVATAGRNEVTFSQARGFFSAAFPLTLTATVAGSTIRYTLDGSAPTATLGTVYTGPITITPDTTPDRKGTRLVRAVAMSPKAAYSPVTTNTYLFINGVTNPATEGVVAQSTLVASIRNHATYGPLIDDALLALPTVSVILPSGLSGSENPASIELFDPQHREAGFQIDCGISWTGTTSLRSPKLSMAAKFRNEYGQPKLRYPVFAGYPYQPDQIATEFKQLRLRSGSHDTFHWSATREQPPVPYGYPRVMRSGDAQIIRNIWIEEMQARMGQPAKHGRMVHLYLNGSYHGLYHIHERADDDFLASYYPGSSEDFHFTGAANSGSTHGPGDTWSAVWAKLKSSLSDYTEAKRWIDMPNLADYMVLSFYAGNDWDWRTRQNWSAAGPKLADRGGWKFFQQDSDICLQDVNADCTDQRVPDGIFDTLISQHSDFAVLFRDRVYKHCFNDGVLTPAKVAEVYNARANEIFTALVAETARWQPRTSVGTLPWDRDGEWTAEWDYFKNTFFPQRTNILITQLRTRGWYPVAAPEFNRRGGAVPPGFQVALTAPAGATIYYTTDGSDPRLPGGAVAPPAQPFSQPLIIARPTPVLARALLGGEWSAINEAVFVLPGTVPAGFASFCLTEIHYHPADSNGAEFLEFQNTSAGFIDAAGVRVSSAVDFTFPLGTALAPGECILVVGDAARFDATYRNTKSPSHREGIRVAGVWSGALSNGGETIKLTHPDNSPMLEISYRDDGAWPKQPDGQGSSLELTDPAAVPITSAAAKTAWLADPHHWRASSEHHGTPGSAGRRTPSPK